MGCQLCLEKESRSQIHLEFLHIKIGVLVPKNSKLVDLFYMVDPDVHVSQDSKYHDHPGLYGCIIHVGQSLSKIINIFCAYFDQDARSDGRDVLGY